MMRAFVYGTLKRGYWNHPRLEGATFIGEARASGFALYNVSAFPGMIAEKGGKVRGEVYEITPEILRSLDILEGVPWMYKRETISVQCNRASLDVFAYIWQREVAAVDRIKNGNWKPQ
jgi:gamma-glutamylaminecyclotransferase